MSVKTYVATLNKNMQDKIIELLKLNGCLEEDIEMALNSRLCDLQDTIDLEEVFA